MGLTPVPVRGKRKRNMNIALNKPPTALRQHCQQGQFNQDELPVKHQKIKHSLLAILAMRQTRLATLESLPIELLESIFLHSSNLSLPRASPILGAKLSGKATLLRLFTWGFHDTWDQWFGIPTSEKVFFGPQRRTVTSWSQVARGNAALQSAILELPWVDIDFILQAQQMWADTYAKDRWYQHPVPIKDECSYGTKHDCEGGFGHFNAKECFEVDYQNYKTWVFPSDFIHDWSTYDVHPLTRIPESLITGPWDEEKQRRLFWLIRGGAHIGPPAHGTQPWEVKVECLRNAVIDAPSPNPFIANLLFTRLDTSWGITGIPDDVIRAEVRKLQKRLDSAEGEAKEVFLGTKMLLGLPAVRSQYPPH